MASVMGNNNELWLPETSVAKRGKESKIENWWEVKISDNPADARPTRGATPLVERCMRVHGFKESFAKRVLKGYRQFMELKSVMNDWNELKLAPPVAVHQMWEQHLLDNLNYTDDCLLLFGRVIGHNPDAILDAGGLRDRIMTTKIAFQARYGDDLDQEVWDFGDSHGQTAPQPADNHSAPIKIHSEPNPAVSHTPRGRLPVASVAGEPITMSPPRNSNQANAHTTQMVEDAPITNVSNSRSVTGSRTITSPSHRGMVPQSTAVNSTSRSMASPKTNTAATPNGNEPITIFLRDQTSGEETYFSLRYKSTLRIVFTVFAERRGMNQELLKFSYSGQNLTGYETPHSLGLEDRARIDVQVTPRRG